MIQRFGDVSKRTSYRFDAPFLFFRGFFDMYKIADDSIHSNIIYTEADNGLAISVSEISSAKHNGGFDSGEISGDFYSLLFVSEGECIVNGIKVESSAMLIAKPEASLRYTVPTECQGISVYRIIFNGSFIENILNEAKIHDEIGIFYVSEPTIARKILGEMLDGRVFDSVNAPLFAAGCLLKLLSINRNSEKCRTVSYSPYTRTVLDYIHHNYQEPITEKMLAGLVNLSTNYMHKVFLADMHTTPIHYLNSYRIGVSKELLRDLDLSVSDVAAKVGIAGSDYFCRVFRKYNDGISPSKYRKTAKRHRV